MTDANTTETRPALDSNATYGVDDGDGNAITDGLSANSAYEVAQRIADERAETVYLYDSRPLSDEEIMDDVQRPTIAVLPATEHLSDEMVAALREEAAAAGDDRLYHACDTLMHPRHDDHQQEREMVLRAINDARAQDDSRPFVRVVPTETRPAIDIATLRASGWSESRDEDCALWLWPPHVLGEIEPQALATIARLGLKVERDDEGAPVCRVE